jgi:hypothetical protein
MSAMLVASPGTETRRVEWDPADEESVAKVKEEFDTLIEHNFGYKRTPDGFEQIKSFDPEAEEIRIAPRLVGG